MIAPLNDRKSMVNRFFTRIPPKPNVGGPTTMMAFGGAGILLAVVLFVAGASSGTSSGAAGACCGVVFLIGGVIMGVIGAVKYFGLSSDYQRRLATAVPKPPAEYVRGLLLKGLHEIEQRALQSLGLDSDDLEIEAEVSRSLRDMAIAAGQIPDTDLQKHPVVLVGPASATRMAMDSVGGSLLFERTAVSVICPTESQFSVYDCVLHLDTGGISSERTLQYPYSHVAAVTTLTESITLTVPTQPNLPAPKPSGVEAAFDLSRDVELEFQYLTIQVSSGNAAQLSCGLIINHQRSLSSFMLDFSKVTEAVRAALRQRGVFGPRSRDTTLQ